VTITLMLIGMLALALLNVPIAIALAFVAMVAILFIQGADMLPNLALEMFNGASSFPLLAIPLFILSGALMNASSISRRLIAFASALVGFIRGGLSMVSIGTSVFFAEISGSAVADVAALGTILIPAMKSRGYSKEVAAATMSSAASLAIIIPPSIPMILYAVMAQTSTVKLFVAGIVPGLLLTGLFMAYVLVHALLKPEIAPREKGPQNFREFVSAVSDLVPFVLVIGGTMGSLYAGWVTPTEAAAAGCAVGLVASAIWGKLGWKELRTAMVSSVMISGNILLIVYTAFVFSYAISVAGVGEALTTWLVALKLSRLEFFAALFVLYTILGCLVESLGMIVITVPLLYPVLLQYHIDPVWFGIILVLFIELGQISPPIGINLFVIQSIWDGKLQDIVFGTIPFHLLMFALLVMLVFWPEIALWLPAHMGKGP
jgi:C4-dicarboxylate transporter DctM subunit